MPSAKEMFEHLYHDRLKDLKSNQQQNELDLQKAKAQEGTPLVHIIILEEYDSLMKDMIASLNVSPPVPESVFKNGLTALKRIEQFRFLMDNLLEAVKRDESLQNSLIRYNALGLTGVTFPPNMGEEKKQSPWPSMRGAGRLLSKVLKGLGNAALTVMEMVTNAINLIPQLAAIKPKAVIGFTGPFPTLSLQFEVEVELMALHELFRRLTEGD
jgi:hypothetical protein